MKLRDLRKTVFFSCFVILIVPGRSCPAGPSVNGDTSEPVQRSKEFLSQLAREEFETAAASFDATVKKVLPPEKLGQTWKQLRAQFGSLKVLGAIKTEKIGELTAVVVTCEFEKGKLNARLVFNPENEITGLWFSPPAPPARYSWPRYVDPTMFEEESVTIGAGEWALPGTLTIPQGEGPFPAVVLVHGSGPNDRDETIGPNKVFRDLAGGLATVGIAVLRYDKRTKVHGAKLAARQEGITLKEETIDDAVLAVRLLKSHPRIEPRRRFVLGHSLGGYVAPRIAQAAPELAGAVIMAGSTRPLEDLIIDQYRYIGLTDGTQSKETQKMLETIAEQVTKVKALTADSKVTKEELPLGVPLAYWLDMKSYDPVATAAGLQMPLLILQGGRDYQVTAADFEGWTRGLKGRDNVTFEWLPRFNHLFIAGNKRSEPGEYMQPGHVSPKVVERIADWIKAQSPAEG